MLKLAWFSSARDPEAVELLRHVADAINRGELALELTVVVCTAMAGETAAAANFIGLVEELGLPLVLCSEWSFLPDQRRSNMEEWRIAYHQALAKELSPFSFDLGVLAGYMLIVPAAFLEFYVLINLHPALPKTHKGSWQQVVHKVLAQKDPAYGCMMHVVTTTLDGGPAITYAKFDVPPNATFQSIRDREFSLELPLLVASLRLLAAYPSLVLRQQGLFSGDALLGPIELKLETPGNGPNSI